MFDVLAFGFCYLYVPRRAFIHETVSIAPLYYSHINRLHSNVRDSSPSLLKNGLQLQQRIVTPDTQHAKVIMNSTGYTYPVEFSVRRATDSDRRMEVLGTVVDSWRGKVFGWIAKVSEAANSVTFKHFPQLETQANADEPFEVSGRFNGMGTGNTYSCGPLNSIFTPERSKVYLVEFQFVGQGCEQHVLRC